MKLASNENTSILMQYNLSLICCFKRVLHRFQCSCLPDINTYAQMFQKVGSGGGPIFKVVKSVKKGVLNLFLSISMAYNVP